MNRQLGQIGPHHTVQRTVDRRAGFTLIEMLIAVTIIALMATMVLVGIGRIVGGAREAATQVTLKQVHTILQQQQMEFNNAFSQNPPRRLNEPCLGLDADQNLKAILERKRLFREAFPQREADLFDAEGNLTRIGTIVTAKVAEIWQIERGSAPTATELATSRRDRLATNGSAELLYIILTEGSAYGTGVADSDQFSTTQLRDSEPVDTTFSNDQPGDGLMEIVDGWENPVRFYRWPTRLIRPVYAGNPADPVRGLLPAVNETYWKLLTSANLQIETLGVDPDDQTSAIYRYIERQGIAPAAVELGTPTCTFHTPDTYARMLVVSQGPDLQLGLFEPDDTANFGHLAQPEMDPATALESALNDNITNLQGVE